MVLWIVLLFLRKKTMWLLQNGVEIDCAQMDILSEMPDFTDYSMKNRTYRYYTGKPLYPFGYGLSYTQFEYRGLKLSADTVAAGESVVASVTVANTGDRAGKDVVQIYGQAPFKGNVEKSSVVLIGFAKTGNIPAGESETVEVTVNLKDLTSYDVASNGGKGGYIIFVSDDHLATLADFR